MDVAKVDLFFERLNHRLIIMIEKEFTCPYCWENQLKMVDPSLSTQTYIEDCEVCCNPIEFHINITDDELVQITPISIEQ